MSDSIVETIYNTLDTRTDEIMQMVNERNELEDEIKSGNYTSKAMVEKGMYRKSDTLRGKIVRDSDKAFKEVQGILDQYRTDIANMNRLDPADLTDDVKLLQDGIILTPKDIEGMLERNSDNRTMTQIILRYAKDKDIDIGRVYYISAGQEELQIADRLENIARLYVKWMSKPKGKDVLNKFFRDLR